MVVRWTQPAVQDLTLLCDYIQDHDGDLAARRIALRIYDGVNSLEAFPYMGRPGRKSGTRELVIPGLPWLAIYRPHHDVIEIIRILHGAQRWP